MLLVGVLFFLLGFSLLTSQPSPAAEVKGQSRRVIMAYTSFSPQYAPAWIAKEMNIFEKNGIRADLVYVRGGVEATQALIGGDVSFINAGVSAVVDATLGGADLIVLASPSVRSETILAAKGNITSPAELKGKKIAVGSLAGPALLTLRMILQIYGLTDKDVNYLVSGPTVTRFAALNAGAVDATLLTPPYTLYAKKAGYTLFDNIPAVKEIEIANASIVSSRKFAQQEPLVVDRVVRSIIEGLHVYKTNAADTLTVLKKYLRIQNSEELQYTYQFYSNSLP